MADVNRLKEPTRTNSTPSCKIDTSRRDQDFRYKSAAVAADCAQVSSVGKTILQQGGNAVDAAIASLVCLGLTSPQSMGLGGGFCMTVYNAATGQSTVIDARETAPQKATDYVYRKNYKMAKTGPLSIGVPAAEVKGYWYAHRKYGHLPWSNLFEPAIKMAEEGFPVPVGLHNAICDARELLSTEPTLREVYFNKETGQLYKHNEIMQLPQLAKTLKMIAAEGLESFETSSLFKNMLADLEDISALVSREDLLGYQVLEKQPIETRLDGTFTVISPSPPCSGVLLAFVLNILEGYKLGPQDVASVDAKVQTYHRAVEAFKFAYAKRATLEDEDFADLKELVSDLTSKTYAESIRELIKGDTAHDASYYGLTSQSTDTSGTSHLCVLDQEGNAVSVTSTINDRFGAGLRGRRTGIIWNNELDDFTFPARAGELGPPPSQNGELGLPSSQNGELGLPSSQNGEFALPSNQTSELGLPPSHANLIVPGKRPLSDMCPVIILGPGGGAGHPRVKLVLGTAGGTLITCAMAWIIMHNLWLGKGIKEAIDSSRLYHQLLPSEIRHDEGFDKEVLQRLRLRGHTTLSFKRHLSIIQGIEVCDEWVSAESDYRKGGLPDGY